MRPWIRSTMSTFAIADPSFHPLMLTVEALEIENPGYTMSWAE